jgi:replicative DNA helicase
VEAGTRVVQYGYAGAEGADVAEVVDRAQAEIYDVADRRLSDDFVPLEDLLQPTMDEIDAIASSGGLARGVPTGFTELDEVTNGLHPGQMIIVAARPGVGKALALDTPLPTPTGWTTMGDVAVGDELLDADGHPTRVVAATEVMLSRPCYEVEFSDGTVIVADAAHQWPTIRGIRMSAQLRCDWDAIAAAGSTARYVERGTTTALLAPLLLRIDSVRRVDSVPVRCVEVDNTARLYLAGRGMVPTHNSTLGLDFMRSCSIKHRLASVIFSLEMSKSEIVMRLLSAEAKIKLADMRSGRMNDDDWTRLARRMSEISEAPLYIDDSPNLTMMEIRAKARRLRQKADLKLIVVDYMQLMTSGKKFESRQVEVSEFSRNLKLLAKELEVPVVAISQLNRGPEQRTDKKPMLADLRESGSLEQDSDVVILLHRPDAFDRDDPRGGEADLILAKHRNGPTKTVTVAHQLHLSRFANMAR